MNTDTSKVLPYGLFRYLYNHYQVRYPDFHMFLLRELPDELLKAFEAIKAADLETHLTSESWLVAITRPDLAESVQSCWDSMTPRSRGDYLAGFTERTYFGCADIETRFSFIREQLRDTRSIDLSPEAACEMGCCLLAMKMENALTDLLQADVDWEAEIDRSSARDAKRWKSIGKLSRRVIDIFLEAALILKRGEAVKLFLNHGADPNIYVWQLERSSNGLYSALSYAIHHNFNQVIEVMLDHGADPRGSESVPARSPLAQAFEKTDFTVIKRLLSKGACLEEGPRYTEAPLFYAKGSPVEWVQAHLSELLALLPIEAKPLFHSPHAMGGYYYTHLECLWGDPEKLAFAEQIGMDLRLTEYEMARLIQRKQHITFCTLVGRLGESKKNEALTRVLQEWPEFSQN